MIDHFTLSVRDLAESRAFYEKALAPLGYKLTSDYKDFLGFGDTRPYFWLKQGATPSTPMHIAFKANSRGDVDAFHEAALAAGAKDDGKPGPRPHYHQNYYGGFVIDPNGNPIEAVCHAPSLPTPAKTRAALKAIAKRAAPKKSARKPATKRSSAPKKATQARKKARGAAR